MNPVGGFRLGTVRAGIRYPDRRDLVVMELAPGGTAAAVFTRNRFRAAPVVVAERHLALQTPRYLLVNTGYANAGTGPRGETDAEACCRALAGAAGCAVEEVLPFSTGVIGEPLPVERIRAALPAAVAALSEDGWHAAAEGIQTTDTRIKLAGRRFDPGGGGACVVTGMAKGAGMIRPDMATMLAFVATDARVSAEVLDRILRTAVDRSFNRVTVDGDTSTNDACLLAATGAGPQVADAAAVERLQEAVDAVCVDLARAIAADGEGATRLVDVVVTGARETAEAERTAFTVAESPLVKTALAAADPNWGRILAAVGRAGIDDLDVAGVTIALDDLVIAEGGARADGYDEAGAARRLDRDEVVIRIDLGRGSAEATVWTCDLTAEYVRINAEYRT